MIRPNEIRPFDVKCGKNRDCVDFPGSVRLREIVDSYAHQYSQSPSKFEKMAITKNIYDQVSKTSRFLKFNETEQVWEEISMNAARDKIGHSLRFAGRAKRRVRKLKRSESVSSLSSSESERGNNFANNSLAFHLQHQRSIDSSVAGQVVPVPTTMPPLNPTVVSMPPVVSRMASEIYEGSNHMDVDADELLMLLQSDQGVHNRFQEGLTGDILQMVQTMDKAEKETEQNFLSLMSEPLGDWEERKR